MFFVLETSNKPRKPPLEVAMGHAEELVRLMSSSGLGSCAFASVTDLLEHWPRRFPPYLFWMREAPTAILYCLKKKQTNKQMNNMKKKQSHDPYPLSKNPINNDR